MHYHQTALMRAPSMETLMQVPDMTEEVAKRIRQLIHDGKPITALRYADEKIGTYGVEHCRNNKGWVEFYYCNTGDTYATTLCYRPGSRRVWVGTWGDFVESHERLFREE